MLAGSTCPPGTTSTRQVCPMARIRRFAGQSCKAEGAGVVCGFSIPDPKTAHGSGRSVGLIHQRRKDGRLQSLSPGLEPSRHSLLKWMNDGHFMQGAAKCGPQYETCSFPSLLLFQKSVEPSTNTPSLRMCRKESSVFAKIHSPEKSTNPSFQQ